MKCNLHSSPEERICLSLTETATKTFKIPGPHFNELGLGAV